MMDLAACGRMIHERYNRELRDFFIAWHRGGTAAGILRVVEVAVRAFAQEFGSDDQTRAAGERMLLDFMRHACGGFRHGAAVSRTPSWRAWRLSWRLARGRHRRGSIFARLGLKSVDRRLLVSVGDGRDPFNFPLPNKILMLKVWPPAAWSAALAGA